VLRQGLKNTDDPALDYSLGLLLIRQQRRDDAIGALRTAAQRAPTVPRYAYVYALALDSAGRRGEAIGVLEAAHGRATGDRDILVALVSLTQQSGDTAAAQRWGAELQALQRGADACRG
jgi:predicted Zn-dependent protease